MLPEELRSSGEQGPKHLLPGFENETLLQQALAALLLRMPGVSDVQILQGAQELGKDIVFRAAGPLQEPLNCACVVKNKPFTGKAGDSQSMRALMEQVEQALDTAFVDNGGERQAVHIVYVMNPHQATPAAMASVEGRLKARAGQVRFITGPQLYQCFQQHWPDFLEAESSALAQFARDLADVTGATRALTWLALNYDVGTGSKAAECVYVAPSFEREVLLYALPENCERVLSEPQVRQHWGMGSLRHFEAVLSAVTALLEHLHSWPFPGLGPGPDLRRTLAAYRKLRRELSSAVRGALGLRPGEVGGRLRARAEGRASLPLKRSDELVELARVAEEQAQVSFDHVRRSLGRVIVALEVAAAAQMDLLADPEFLHACAVDDCLRAAKSALVKVTGRRQFALGKEAHHRSSRPLLIVGSPGTGKTTFCTRNALQDAQRYVGEATGPLPVYVALHRLAPSTARTFDEAFLSTAGTSALLPAGSESRREGPLRVYLDGVDEIGDAASRRRVLELAREGERLGANRQIIMTARDYLYDPLLSWLPRVSLAGLADDEVELLASQWLDDDGKATVEFMRQLRGSPSIKALVRVPLLATVTVLVYKRTGRIPANRARLYLTFTNMLCGGWDLAKGVVRRSYFDISSKIHVLSSLAGGLHAARLRQFDEERFQQASRRLLSRRSVADADDLLSEVIRDGLITRTGSDLHFCHLTFQEFLTAKEILGDPAARTQDLLKRYLQGDDWWREVLAFVIELSENPERVAQWFDRSLPRPGTNSRADTVHQMFDSAFPDFDRDEYRRRSEGSE